MARNVECMRKSKETCCFSGCVWLTGIGTQQITGNVCLSIGNGLCVIPDLVGSPFDIAMNQQMHINIKNILQIQ